MRGLWVEVLVDETGILGGDSEMSMVGCCRCCRSCCCIVTVDLLRWG
jgi:hypothetical protein